MLLLCRWYCYTYLYVCVCIYSDQPRTIFGSWNILIASISV